MKSKPLTRITKTTRTPRKVPALAISRILATTDFSEGSRSGVRYAMALARRLGSRVALLHVVEPLSRIAGMNAVIIAQDATEEVASTKGRLAMVARSESRPDVPLTTSVRQGHIFHEINNAARETNTDLIVIATNGYTGLKHILLGSTAERVLRHAPCSVLTVSTIPKLARAHSRVRFKLKKILVPIDFSNLCMEALSRATLLGSHFHAEIVLLHIVETFPIDDILGGDLMNHRIVPLMKKAEADLESIARGLRKSASLKVTAIVRSGIPFEEISHAARTRSTDLIVMTTHGHTGLKHVWLGSTTERVVRQAPCPVLTVREPTLDLINERN